MRYDVTSTCLFKMIVFVTWLIPDEDPLRVETCWIILLWPVYNKALFYLNPLRLECLDHFTFLLWVLKYCLAVSVLYLSRFISDNFYFYLSIFPDLKKNFYSTTFFKGMGSTKYFDSSDMLGFRLILLSNSVTNLAIRTWSMFNHSNLWCDLTSTILMVA